MRLKQKVRLLPLQNRLLELYRVRTEIVDLWQKTRLEKLPEVGRNDVAGVVSRMRGIPLEDLTEEEKIKLLNIEARIHERIVGQNQAVDLVSKAIRRSRAGLKEPHHPIGTFLFLGPTGVGKSELCKALAEVLYGDEEMLVRLDMIDYIEKHTVSRLIGSPPGYVGYDEGGQLTEIVRRHPFSIILFDEIEKAHPEVFNILLQLMEDGRLTDGQGHLVSFKNCILIMTSNIGSDMIYENTLGFSQKKALIGEMPEYEILKEKVLDALKNVFKPEFMNRIDEIVVFRSLLKEDMIKIAGLELERLGDLMREKGLDLRWSKKVVAWIVEKGYYPQYGARPIKRFIQKEVENRLSEAMIAGGLKEGSVIKLKVLKDQLFLKVL